MSKSPLTLSELLERPLALPTVPAVVHRLIATLDADDPPLHEVSDALAEDPVLGAKTLRLANSACFHVSRKIDTLPAALQLLGFTMVRNLVLSVALGHSFRQRPGIDMPRFWRHSLATAALARWLAALTPVRPDQAFVTGLVQGLGHLVLRAADADDLQALDRRCAPLAAGRAAAEVERLGFHHGDVARELAQRWRFPAPIALSLAPATQPAQQGEPPWCRCCVWRSGRHATKAPRPPSPTRCRLRPKAWS